MSIENLSGDGLGKRRRRRRRRLGSSGVTLVGRRRRGKGCSAAGVKANGRLRKGYRWAKGRAGCAIPARRRRKRR